MSKNRELLRPFDLEAAKRGEPICWSHLDWNVVFIGAATDGQVAYECDGDVGFSRYPEDSFRMKPLCWVEDRPVYKDDVLWNKLCPKYRYDAIRFEDGRIYSSENETWSYCELIENLTWEEPKIALCRVEGRPVYKGDVLFS